MRVGVDGEVVEVIEESRNRRLDGCEKMVTSRRPVTMEAMFRIPKFITCIPQLSKGGGSSLEASPLTNDH